jgi:hypothetical protein
MYSHQISEMAELLAKTVKLPMEPAARTAMILDFVHALSNYWSDKIAITWSLDDVRHVAEMHAEDYTCSEAQLRECLHNILHGSSADIGVTWATIDDELQHLTSDEKTTCLSCHARA